jgi:DNA ligase 1
LQESKFCISFSICDLEEVLFQGIHFHLIKWFSSNFIPQMDDLAECRSFLSDAVDLPQFHVHVNMPPKQNRPDTPSPSKKRRIESAPVKRGVDFFFKKQSQKQTQPAPASLSADVKLFVDSDGEDEDIKRIKQQEEDERLARELQQMEGMQEIEDEEFAKRLARDYEALDQETEDVVHGNEEVKEEAKDAEAMSEDDLYGSLPALNSKSQSNGPAFVKTDPSDPPPSTTKFTLDNLTTPTSLEQIYSIPLDKDVLDFSPTTDAPCASTWSPNRTPYAFLTHAFILINSTRSRLKITSYLVNCLRVIIHHDPSSLLPLVWLTTNAIAPPFEGIELNLGGSVITKALTSASGLTNAAIKGLYDKYGDVGDVCFEAKMAVRTLVAPAPLTVNGVYSALRNIARAKGQGSAETKRRLVERLLVSAKGEEVRYIGRTLVQHVTSLVCFLWLLFFYSG